ncbi:MAG TPA: hypothetical protein VKF32_01575, partial [Thermoanaerobaculia bacterium]|nr:hypothetical protein [Thermoanaerobaculia bacterium]
PGQADRVVKEEQMRTPTHLGTILLGIWLILFGLLTQQFQHIAFARSHDVLAVLAIVAGVAFLLRR